MNTIRTVIAVADKAVSMAEAEGGIEIAHVALSTVLGVRLHPEDPALTPALALALGLTKRHVMERDDERVEFFDGELDGIAVNTHWVLPALIEAPPLAVVVDTDTREVMTEPIPLAEAEALVAGKTYRRTHVEAVAR